MSKQIALFAVLALFLFSGCNNSAKQQQKSTSEDEIVNVEDKVSGEEQTSRADESPAGNEESQWNLFF
jgi:outer membrane murein-binding lipoprotein Lpp